MLEWNTQDSRARGRPKSPWKSILDSITQDIRGGKYIKLNAKFTLRHKKRKSQFMKNVFAACFRTMRLTLCFDRVINDNPFDFIKSTLGTMLAEVFEPGSVI